MVIKMVIAEKDGLQVCSRPRTKVRRCPGHQFKRRVNNRRLM